MQTRRNNFFLLLFSTATFISIIHCAVHYTGSNSFDTFETFQPISNAAFQGRPVSAIAAGLDFTVALDSEGLLYCWGVCPIVSQSETMRMSRVKTTPTRMNQSIFFDNKLIFITASEQTFYALDEKKNFYRFREETRQMVFREVVLASELSFVPKRIVGCGLFHFIQDEQLQWYSFGANSVLFCSFLTI